MAMKKSSLCTANQRPAWARLQGLALLALACLILPTAAGAQQYSSDWIDIKGKSEREVIELLQKQVRKLKNSKLADQWNRERPIKQQEREKREKFLKELSELDARVSQVSFERTRQQTLKNQRSNEVLLLKSKLSALNASRERLLKRLQLIPFQVAVVGWRPTDNYQPLEISERIRYEISRQSIEVINGVVVRLLTVVENGGFVKEVVKTELSGTTNTQFVDGSFFNEEALTEFQVHGIADVYPLADVPLEQADQKTANLSVRVEFITQPDQIPDFIQTHTRTQFSELIKDARKFNNDSERRVQEAIKDENEILDRNEIPAKAVLLAQIQQKETEIGRIQQQIETLADQLAQVKQEYQDKRFSEQRVDLIPATQIQDRRTSEPQLRKNLIAEAVTKFYAQKPSLSLSESSLVEEGVLTQQDRQHKVAPALPQQVRIMGVYGYGIVDSVMFKTSLAFEYRFDPKVSMAYRNGSTSGALENEPFTEMPFVKVSGGSYELGNNSGHRVTVKDFWLAQYEVRQSDWIKIMGSDPSYFDELPDDHPVENVSWEMVQDFITKLNQQNGLNCKGEFPYQSGCYRLPSEIEWEYACKLGDNQQEYGTKGGTLSRQQANYGTESCCNADSSDGHEHTAPVQSYQPNDWNLYQMSGNVWEWVQDEYSSNYGDYGKNKAIYTGSGDYRVVRGGSWGNDPEGVRCADRFNNSPARRYGDLGFRLARTD